MNQNTIDPRARSLGHGVSRRTDAQTVADVIPPPLRP